MPNPVFIAIYHWLVVITDWLSWIFPFINGLSRIDSPYTALITYEPPPPMITVPSPPPPVSQFPPGYFVPKLDHLKLCIPSDEHCYGPRVYFKNVYDALMNTDLLCPEDYPFPECLFDLNGYFRESLMEMEWESKLTFVFGIGFLIWILASIIYWAIHKPNQRDSKRPSTTTLPADPGVDTSSQQVSDVVPSPDQNVQTTEPVAPERPSTLDSSLTDYNADSLPQQVPSDYHVQSTSQSDRQREEEPVEPQAELKYDDNLVDVDKSSTEIHESSQETKTTTSPPMLRAQTSSPVPNRAPDLELTVFTPSSVPNSDISPQAPAQASEAVLLPDQAISQAPDPGSTLAPIPEIITSVSSPSPFALPIVSPVLASQLPVQRPLPLPTWAPVQATGASRLLPALRSITSKSPLATLQAPPQKQTPAPAPSLRRGRYRSGFGKPPRG